MSRRDPIRRSIVKGWTIGSYVGRKEYGCAKQSYSSHGAADAHLRSLQKRDLEWKHLGPLEVYRCKRCHKLHIGHQRRKL